MKLQDRSKTASCNQWDLSHIYKTRADWEKALTEATRATEALLPLATTLGTSANALAAGLAQILQAQQAQRFEVLKQEAETFVQNSIRDFPDWFKIPEFKNFFADALRVKGDRFETAAFIKHLENLKEHFRKEFIAEQNANKENKSELDNLKNLTPTTIQQKLSTKSIDDYSPEELDKAISELV